MDQCSWLLGKTLLWNDLLYAESTGTSWYHLACPSQCYFSCCFSVSVKVLDIKFFSVTIMIQLCYFSFCFSYYSDFSVFVLVSFIHVCNINVRQSNTVNHKTLFTFRNTLLYSFLLRQFLWDDHGHSTDVPHRPVMLVWLVNLVQTVPAMGKLCGIPKCSTLCMIFQFSIFSRY